MELQHGCSVVSRLFLLFLIDCIHKQQKPSLEKSYI